MVVLRTWRFYVLMLLFRMASCAALNNINEIRRSFLEKLLYSTSASSMLLKPSPTAAAVTSNNNNGIQRRIYTVPTPPIQRDLAWPLGKVAFSLLPLAGGERRATVMTELVPGTIYALDQIQGIVNVNVPVRMIVIKLRNNKENFDDTPTALWIHNPIAPTPQALTMIHNLETQLNATVQHLVLGSVALEHKATFGPFARHFPQATCYLQPGQWSFPIDLPIEYLGVTQRGKRLQVLNNNQSSSSFSWQDEIDYRILGPLQFQSVGGFSETVFYHRPTQSLVVTDLVVAVSDEPPAILEEDPRALLFHARDKATDIVQDTIETRKKGWRRMVQFGLFFFPSQITVSSFYKALEDAKHVPMENRNLGTRAIPFFDTLYPWSWADNDADLVNFQAVAQAKLFCPPILTKLILDREPKRVVEFADRVAQAFPDIQRILPSHLDCPIECTAQDWRNAFRPLESTPDRIIPEQPLAVDLALLQAVSDSLTQFGIVAPSQVCDGEPARREGRFRNGYR